MAQNGGEAESLQCISARIVSVPWNRVLSKDMVDYRLRVTGGRKATLRQTSRAFFLRELPGI